jgi:hypothetical protein
MAEIIWIGHAPVLLRGERTVYIDPWQVIVGTRADAEAFEERCGVPVEILDPQS